MKTAPKNQNFLFVMLFLGMILLSPCSAEEPEEACIKLNIENDKFSSRLIETIQPESFKLSATTIEKGNKPKKKSFAKKFGPIEIGLRPNPFNPANSGFSVNLDILRSYEILCSTPSSLGDFHQAFKADPDYNLIDPTVLSLFRGGNLPANIWRTLNSLPSS